MSVVVCDQSCELFSAISIEVITHKLFLEINCASYSI